MSLSTKIFAENLEDLIKESGKTLKCLSDEIGISTGALSKYQNDEAVASIEALNKIAVYFNVSADWLLGLSDTKSYKADIRAISKKYWLSDDEIQFLEEANSNPMHQWAFKFLLRNDKFKQFLGVFVNRSTDEFKISMLRGRDKIAKEEVERGERIHELDNKRFYADGAHKDRQKYYEEPKISIPLEQVEKIYFHDISELAKNLLKDFVDDKSWSKQFSEILRRAEQVEGEKNAKKEK